MRCAWGRSGVSVFFASVLMSACGPGTGVETHPGGSAPAADGERVIDYDVDVEEDDTRCNARVPYKYSTEHMTIEWHTDHDITMYARGGLYQKELTLDDHGNYSDDGTAGVCLPGSTVNGRLTREGGEALAICKKRDCDVYFKSKARRVIAQPDAGIPDAG